MVETEKETRSDPRLRDVPEVDGNRKIGPVTLVRLLDETELDALYLGYHERLEKDFAVRVMARPADASDDTWSRLAERFMQQAKSGAKLLHQNLCNIYDAEICGDFCWALLEHVESVTLEKYLENNKNVDEAAAARIVLGAARAMGLVHSAGLIHGHLSPQTLLVTPDGRAKITDLGRSEAAESKQSSKHGSVKLPPVISGDMHYISPEQSKSVEGLTPATDVWSLGVVLYQLLAGETPWPDEDAIELIYKIRKERHPDLGEIHAGISPVLKEIINGALAKTPAERYGDCNEMAEQLMRYMYSKPDTSSVRPATPVEKTPEAAGKEPVEAEAEQPVPATVRNIKPAATAEPEKADAPEAVGKKAETAAPTEPSKQEEAESELEEELVELPVETNPAPAAPPADTPKAGGKPGSKPAASAVLEAEKPPKASPAEDKLPKMPPPPKLPETPPPPGMPPLPTQPPAAGVPQADAGQPQAVSTPFVPAPPNAQPEGVSFDAPHQEIGRRTPSEVMFQRSVPADMSGKQLDTAKRQLLARHQMNLGAVVVNKHKQVGVIYDVERRAMPEKALLVVKIVRIRDVVDNEVNFETPDYNPRQYTVVLDMGPKGLLPRRIDIGDFGSPVEDRIDKACNYLVEWLENG